MVDGKRLAWSGAVVLLVCSSAHAARADEVIPMPCRPTVACTADIVPAGTFELESGGISKIIPGDRPTFAAPFLAKLSVTHWLQLQLGSAGPTFASQKWLMDVGAAAAKVRLVEQGSWNPSLAFTLGGAFPLSRETKDYTPTKGAQAAVYVSRDIGAFHVDVNLGYNAFLTSGDIAHSWWGAVSTSYAYTKWFGSFHELYYISPPLPDAPRDAGALFGVTFLPVSWAMIDVGADVSLFQKTRTVSAFAGLTTVVPDLFGKKKASQPAVSDPFSHHF